MAAHENCSGAEPALRALVKSETEIS
jgi:hypothetical protein